MKFQSVHEILGADSNPEGSLWIKVILPKQCGLLRSRPLGSTANFHRILLTRVLDTG